MASVSVLYVEDKVVAPYLELLRNICEPNSNSRPHITVRLFDRLSIPDYYRSAKISYVDLVEPGSFGLEEGDEQTNYTVFIRCNSSELLPLEHKPDFPMSEFHITIYDGTSKTFAAKLLKTLNKYNWNLRIKLPKRTSLVEIELKPKRNRKSLTIKPNRETYRSAPSRLLKQIIGEKLESEFLNSLSITNKFLIIQKICEHLMEETQDFFRPVNLNRKIQRLNETNDESNYAIHLTPPELAIEISRFALSFLTTAQRKSINFGDPAAGTGVFFSALLQTTNKRNISSAIGIDISDKHIIAAKRRWSADEVEFILGDYLHLELLPKRNFILANPPYLRHQGIPTKYKSELRHRASIELGTRISGLSGQYIYFVILGHRWMEHGAVAAWLIPSEFMQSAYGSALRFYLTQRVELLAIHEFDSEDIQFENVQTLPCVVFLRNTAPSQAQQIRFSHGGTIEKPNFIDHVSLDSLRSEPKWRIKPISKIDRTGDYVKLGDLFSVRRGIATGANDFFIVDRKKIEEFDIPYFAVKPILPKIRSLNSDIIERTTEGFPNVERQLFVIDCDLPIETIQKNHKKFKAYLDSGIERGVTNGFLVSKRKLWYRQEQRTPCAFLCTYMGKNMTDKPPIRFLWNKSDAIAVNTYLMLYPNTDLQNLINNKPKTMEILFDLLNIASRDAVPEFTRNHAEGLSKIEPRELQEVWLGPLPRSILETARLQLF